MTSSFIILVLYLDVKNQAVLLTSAELEKKEKSKTQCLPNDRVQAEKLIKGSTKPTQMQL